MLPEIMSSSDEAQVADPEMANTNGSYVDKRKVFMFTNRETFCHN